MMKTIAAICLALLSAASDAQTTTIYTTIPGTQLRDWSRPGYQVDHFQGGVYRTLPGTSVRDWSAPGWVIQRDPAFEPLMPSVDMWDEW